MTRSSWPAGALLLTILLAACGLARAQSPESASGRGASLTAGGAFTSTYLQYGDHWILGASASMDAGIRWHFGIEGEATWSRWHQQSYTHTTTYLIGPRYQFRGLGNHRYQPFVKFLAGGGEFNFSYNYAHGSYFVMSPGAGVDYRLTSRVRLRLCDVEFQYWPGFTYGAMSNVAISSGIRYRIR